MSDALPLPVPMPGQVDLPALTDALDAATHEERIAWMWSLRSRDIKALFDACADRPARSEDLVVGDGPTWCDGRNALPLFNRFAKVFARVDGRIVGYNWNPKIVAWVIGDGHFELLHHDDRPEAIVEYRKMPPRTHESFPPLRDNNRLFAWLVYGCMYDVVRRVSEDVFVGDSFRTLPGGAAFMLIRPPE